MHNVPDILKPIQYHRHHLWAITYISEYRLYMTGVVWGSKSIINRSIRQKKLAPCTWITPVQVGQPA